MTFTFIAHVRSDIYRQPREYEDEYIQRVLASFGETLTEEPQTCCTHIPFQSHSKCACVAVRLPLEATVWSADTRTFCFRIFFWSAMRVTRVSLATATCWVSVLSGGDSGESESFSLSSLLKLSFLFSARHFLLRRILSCSQLRRQIDKSGSWYFVCDCLFL